MEKKEEMKNDEKVEERKGKLVESERRGNEKKEKAKMVEEMVEKQDEEA